MGKNIVSIMLTVALLFSGCSLLQTRYPLSPIQSSNTELPVGVVKQGNIQNNLRSGGMIAARNGELFFCDSIYHERIFGFKNGVYEQLNPTSLIKSQFSPVFIKYFCYRNDLYAYGQIKEDDRYVFMKYNESTEKFENCTFDFEPYRNFYLTDELAVWIDADHQDALHIRFQDREISVDCGSEVDFCVFDQKVYYVTAERKLYGFDPKSPSANGQLIAALIENLDRFIVNGENCVFSKGLDLYAYSFEDDRIEHIDNSGYTYFSDMTLVDGEIFVSTKEKIYHIAGQKVETVCDCGAESLYSFDDQYLYLYQFPEEKQIKRVNVTTGAIDEVATFR